jgi:dTDP-glucose 4,6-dehydratase
MSTERFVVIGSNSFSGASFVAGALRQGASVLGISRAPEPHPTFLPYRWEPHPSFTFHALDLNKDIDRIDEVVRAFQPDYVVNFAAQGMVAQSWTQPEHWYRTNLLSMVRLHERLRLLPKLKRVVQASTPEVYGSTASLIREDAPFNPSTPYAVSKAACDMHLLALHKAYGYPVAFTRSANVCGPGQLLYRILPKTVICVLTGKKLKLQGGGLSVRSFIHIADVVEGTLRVCRSGKPGQVYHFATARNQTIRSLVEEICRQLGTPFESSVEVTDGRLGQDAAYLLDCTRSRTELDWQPKHTVEQCIVDTIAWIKRDLEALKTQPDEYIHKE